MKAFALIREKVHVTAMTIQARVRQVCDALVCLQQLTLALDSAGAGVDPEVVQGWLRQEGFGVDEHGYFERADVLRGARAGQVDPLTHIYYATEQRRGEPEALRRMYALRHLTATLDRMQRCFPEIAWFYYQDASRFTVVYPMHDPCTVVPADFDWHTYLTYLSVSPEANPQREIRWTPPNIDYGGKGLMVAPSIPLYRGDQLYGVWSFDLPVTMLTRGCTVDSSVQGQQSFIVDRDGYLIAHDTLNALTSPREGQVFRRPLESLGGGYRHLDLARLQEEGEATFVDAQGVSRRAIAHPIPELGWLLVATFPDLELVAGLRRSFDQAFLETLSGRQSLPVADVGGALQPLVDGFNEMMKAARTALVEKEASLRALEESRSYTRELFDTSPIGLTLLDADGACLEVNDELCRILREGCSDVMGEPLLDWFCDASRQEVRRLTTPGRSGAPGTLEAAIVAHGAIVPVRLTARSFHHQGQARVLLAMEDITQQRELQTQLLQSQKMQTIGQLAGGVAHDFNNLLTVIMGNVDILHDELQGQERELVEDLQFAAQRASALTGQLLAFSRRELVQPRMLDLRLILQSSQRLLLRLLDDDVVLETSLEDGLPPIFGDEGQFLQVVMNLVLNACDAFEDGGRIELRLRAAQREGRQGVCLEVEDNGEGMDAQHQEKIFEPFFTTKTHGTGLGLATTLEVVQGMGGQIHVRSAPGRGTTFTLHFWAREDQPATLQGSPPKPAPGALRGAHIVVADDEPLLREAMARTLRRAGVRVHTCPDAEAALRALEDLGEEAALLVTDVVMPRTNGRKLAEQAQQLLPELPVLFVSGYTDDSILRRGVQMDQVRLLRKPFSSSRLLAAVGEILQAH